ncbi:MAG: response regulator [Deltaproteobacteria bacterium]|nr:response regulator [Deltaproteobacteria bacterium]
MEEERKILVADDDDGYRVPIVNILQDFGYAVAEATDKAGVLKHATEIDTLVVDVRLPSQEMEGIAAVRELAQPGKRYTVVFISVLPQDLAKDKLKELEDLNIRYSWLVKPFELQRLLEVIEEMMSDRGAK